jgi:acyl phosphate:glycerol-3-phosphate acyltransferase
LFGCIQTSHLIGKFKFNVDVKNQGSKNAGASNGVMLFGWKYGIFIGVVDMLKAYVPILIIMSLFSNNVVLASFCGGGVILGHTFPFYMGFNGGKGMSSYFGMILAFNLTFGFYNLVIAAVLLMVTNYVALATVLILIFNPIIIYFMCDSGIYDINFLLSLSFFSLIIFIKHIENLNKIFKGTEKTFWSVFKK